MKKLMLVLALMLVSGSMMYGQDTKIGTSKDADKKVKPKFDTEDEKAIRKTVQNYYSGVVTANIDKLKDSWAMKGGHVKYVDQDKDKKDIVKTIPISLAAKSWTQSPADRASADVKMLDIVENKMAMVKLEFKYNDHTFMDYLTLYKLNDQWKIVHKAYTFVK